MSNTTKMHVVFYNDDRKVTRDLVIFKEDLDRIEDEIVESTYPPTDISIMPTLMTGVTDVEGRHWDIYYSPFTYWTSEEVA